jgi:hypothetical protein
MIYTCIPHLCIVRPSTCYVMTFMDRLDTGTLNEIWVNGGPFSDEERHPRQTGLPEIEAVRVGGIRGEDADTDFRGVSKSREQ